MNNHFGACITWFFFYFPPSVRLHLQNESENIQKSDTLGV